MKFGNSKRKCEVLHFLGAGRGSLQFDVHKSCTYLYTDAPESLSLNRGDPVTIPNWLGWDFLPAGGPGSASSPFAPLSLGLV